MAMANQGDMGNQIKRLRVGSNEIEMQCQRCDKIVTDRIECSGCKLEYCIYCANITPPTVNTYPGWRNGKFYVVL